MFENIYEQYLDGVITREHAIAAFAQHAARHMQIEPSIVCVVLAMQDLFDGMVARSTKENA